MFKDFSHDIPTDNKILFYKKKNLKEFSPQEM